jgi:hypothetical protein
MHMHDWLNEGADPDEQTELTDDEMYNLYEEQLYWAGVNNAWVKAGKKCQVCYTPLTIEEFADNRCPECSKEEVPF